MNKRIQRSICPYDCPASCGLLVETDGQRVVRVQGDPESPATRGLICNKMQHYEASVHAPERAAAGIVLRGHEHHSEKVRGGAVQPDERQPAGEDLMLHGQVHSL